MTLYYITTVVFIAYSVAYLAERAGAKALIIAIRKNWRLRAVISEKDKAIEVLLEERAGWISENTQLREALEPFSSKTNYFKAHSGDIRRAAKFFGEKPVDRIQFVPPAEPDAGEERIES